MTWELSLAGLLVGVLVGMTGMGGGSLMTPLLILLFGFDAKVAVGTDILHGAVFKSFGAARHRMLGDLHAMAWLLVGSIPGVLIGSGMSIRVPDRGLRIAFATILFLSGVKLVDVPYATAVIVATAVAGAAFLVGRWARNLYVRRAAPATD